MRARRVAAEALQRHGRVPALSLHHAERIFFVVHWGTGGADTAAALA